MKGLPVYARQLFVWVLANRAVAVVREHIVKKRLRGNAQGKNHQQQKSNTLMYGSGRFQIR